MKPSIIIAFFLCTLLTGIASAELSSTGSLLGEASEAPFGPREFPAVTVFHDRIWVIGGSGESGPTDDVWSSPDGKTWALETLHAGFGPRMYHGVAVFHNKLWVIGGNNHHDVWSSEDGKTWVLETENAPFGRRANAGVAVYRDALWVIGGGNEGGLAADVWSSADGKRWTLETNNTGFSSRWGHAVASMNNRLWVIGGSYFNDVWSSQDGKNWILVNADAPFEPVDFRTVTVYNNTLWLIGGGSYMPVHVTSHPGPFSYNTIWSSIDGKNWYCENSNGGFTPRFGHGTVLFNNHLWVVSGVIEAKNPPDIVWSILLKSQDQILSAVPPQSPHLSSPGHVAAETSVRAGIDPLLGGFLLLLVAAAGYGIKRGRQS